MKSVTLLNKYQKLLPDVTFKKASSFYWSPKTHSIHFDNSLLHTQQGQWAFLHEVAHAELDHTLYRNDLDLLLLEVAAWKKATQTAQELGLIIDNDHIQDCLDTYRNWLYARSTCPTCTLNGLQINKTAYRCVNCVAEWRISGSRFCRPYRMQSRQQKTSLKTNQAMFM